MKRLKILLIVTFAVIGTALAALITADILTCRQGNDLISDAGTVQRDPGSSDSPNRGGFFSFLPFIGSDPDQDISAEAAESSAVSTLINSNGSLGTLSIPSLDLTVQVFEGTDNAVLARGAGHFEDTSIWEGNVCIAGHNRGTNCYFGDIHTLNEGDTIVFATRLGTRTYAVTAVTKVLETDLSGLAASSENMITLYTCTRNESEYRWCVKGVEVV